MDIAPLKDAFWEIVVDCLVQFHGMRRTDAVAAAADLRARISVPAPLPGPRPAWEDDLFYHNEPFYIACDIAGCEVDEQATAAEYDAIQNRHYGPAERLVFSPEFLARYAAG